jgi:peptidoglycan/xylan/chitin deacetylase (PgdA/CDA1 family)
MRKIVKIVALALILSIASALLISPAFAAGDAEEVVLKRYNNVEIMEAKGGAKAIVSMTFDDGHYETALLLDQLFEEYGLVGSLMMITDNMYTGFGTSKANWEALFANGRLEPQSHSTSHLNMNEDNWEKNNGEANMQNQIVGSKEALEADFEDYDCLTFAIPDSSYAPAAWDLLTKHYYAIRTGNCPLDKNPTNTTVQSLNPTFGKNAGAWHNLYMARLQTENQNTSLQANLNYLKQCVNGGGWYISLTRGVFDTPYPAGEVSNDMSVADARQFFAQVQTYVNQGKVWCATFSDATKYVRERQNSVVSEYETAEGLFVELTMINRTTDGLDLDPEVFNYPLTVRVEVPKGWKTVVCDQGGKKVTYETFTYGGLNFAYVDLVPNGGKAQLFNPSDASIYIDSIDIYQNLSIEDEIAYNIYLPNDGMITSITVSDENTEEDEEGTRLLPTASTVYSGYNKYTLDGLFVNDVETEYEFTVTFKPSSNLDPYVFKMSVLDYLSDVAESEATESEKQLCYDFAVYLKEVYLKLQENEKALLDEKEQETFIIDATAYTDVVAKYEGMTSTAPDLGEAANTGNLADALVGVSFTLNEKPYYLIHVKRGFYGTITVSQGSTRKTYELINGYYHSKSYLIFDVGGLCGLLENISITANGTIGKSGTEGAVSVTATGTYNVQNYVSTVKVNGETPAYATALASYVTSAKKYIQSISE